MGAVATRGPGLPRRARTYVASVVAVGAALAAATIAAAAGVADAIVWADVLVLAAGVAVLTAFPLVLSHRPDSETLEPEELLVVPALVVLHTVDFLLAGVVASILAQAAARWLSPVPRVRSRTPVKMAFNGTVRVIVWGVAAGTFLVLQRGGLPPVAAAAGAALLALAVNHVLVHVVVRLVSPSPVVQDLPTRLLTEGGATLGGTLLAVVVLTYDVLPWAVLVTVGLTTLAARALSDGAVRRSHMLELLRAAQAVHGSVDPEAVEQAAFEQARDMLTCREATIRSEPPAAGELGARLPMTRGGDVAWLVVGSRRGTYRTFDRTDQELLDGLAVLVASARERAEVVAALRHRDELQGLLLSAMSHDLRGPLATARAAVHTLRDRQLDTHAREDILGIQERSLGKMAAILDDLLELVRLERGDELDTAASDPVAVARAVVAEAQPSDGRRVTVTGTTPDVAMPSEALGRTLDNLVENALSHGQGDVRVSLRPEGGTVLVQVDDRGTGVPADLRERVFEPFVSSDRSLGLGLFLARRLVEHHGGALWVEDAADGGASFRFRLPVATRRNGSAEP